MAGIISVTILVFAVCIVLNKESNWKKRIGWALLWAALTFIGNLLINISS